MVADHLSRLKNLKKEAIEESSIREEFLYEYLFSIRMTSWLVDFANVLASDILPFKLSYQQKMKFFSNVKHYL